MNSKLYLIPEDVIQTWRNDQRSQQIDTPVKENLMHIDQNMQSILKDKTLTDYDKEKLYTQKLGTYVQVRDNSSKEANQSQDLMTSIPKMYRAKAESFVKYLHSDKDLSWDEQGQLVLKGKVIPKTHIVDLIHDALRLRKKVKRANGWKEMSQHLTEKNIPREIVGNETWTSTPKRKPSLTVTPGKPRQSKIRARQRIRQWINLK